MKNIEYDPDRKMKVPDTMRCTNRCSEGHTYDLGCVQRVRDGMLEPQFAPEGPDMIEYEVKFTIPLELTEQAQHIVEEILPEFLAYFVRKNNSYAKAEKEFHISETTGTAGQWGELYRKVCMLKAPMWDHEEGHLSFEDSSTLRNDLFGHVLLGEYYHRKGVAED